MIRRLERASELLDAPHHDHAELRQSLDQVAEINRLLGGTRAVLRTIELLAPPPARLDILDVGTGSADIPIAIHRQARRQSRPICITATDLHPQMREIAADRAAHIPSIRIEEADALDLHYDSASFDLVLLSLTLHHFERTSRIRALREAARVARHAVIVNDLERCIPNYIGAKLLALTRWRTNRLTRHDGPISVLRAFTIPELHEMAATAGLEVCWIRRHFFHRLVMVVAAAGTGRGE